jgi:hypothetical protein
VSFLNPERTKQKIGYFLCDSKKSLLRLSHRDYVPDSVNGEFINNSTQVMIAGNTGEAYIVDLWSLDLDSNHASLQYTNTYSSNTARTHTISGTDVALFEEHDEESLGSRITVADLTGKKPSITFMGTCPFLCYYMNGGLYHWQFSAASLNSEVVLENTIEDFFRTPGLFVDQITLEYFNLETRTFNKTNFGYFRLADINNVDITDDDFVFDPNDSSSVLAFRDTNFGDSNWKFLSTKLQSNVFQARLLIAKLLGDKFGYPFQYDLYGIFLGDNEANILSLSFRFTFGIEGMITANLQRKSIEFNGEEFNEENYLGKDFASTVARLTSPISYISDLLQEVRYAKADDGYMVPYIVLARKMFHNSLQTLRDAPTMLWVDGGPESSFTKRVDFHYIVSVLNAGGVVVVPRERRRTDCGFSHASIKFDERRVINDGKQVIRDIHQSRLIGDELLVTGLSYGGTFCSEVIFAQDLPPIKFTVFAHAAYLGGGYFCDDCELDDSRKNPYLFKGLFTHGVHDVRCPIDPVRALAAKHGIELIEKNSGHDPSVLFSKQDFQAYWQEFTNSKNMEVKSG